MLGAPTSSLLWLKRSPQWTHVRHIRRALCGEKDREEEEDEEEEDTSGVRALDSSSAEQMDSELSVSSLALVSG